MLKPSEKFLNAYNDRTIRKKWVVSGNIQTVNDGTIPLDNTIINDGGISISAMLNDGNEFTIGYCAENMLTLQLREGGYYEDVNFKYAVIIPRIGIDFLDGSKEYLKKGVYHVSKVEYKSGYAELTCPDNMCLLDKNVTEKIADGTVGSIVNQICLACGVSLRKANFDGYDHYISFSTEKNMTDYTYRQLLGYICQTICKYAYFDVDGYLVIDWYKEFSQRFLNGGTFDTQKTPYSDGDAADGGNFDDYRSGDVIDGGDFEELNEYDYLHSMKSFSHDTNDIVVTGIKITGKNDESCVVGAEGYILEIKDNPYMQTDVKKHAQYIASRIVGFRFRVFSGSFIHNPIVECGDRAYVIDRKQNVYQTYVTKIDYKILANTKISCEAKSEEEQNAAGFSLVTQAVIKSTEETEKRISAYDIEVQRLNQLMANSFGLYASKEEQSDGSYIFAMHDQPTLEKSTVIWKMVSGAFAVSTDGGKTWNAGIQANGNAVFQILTAIGINADWINAGSIVADRIVGGTLKSKNYVYATSGTYFDLENGVLNTAKLWWDATGQLNASDANISGTIKSKNAEITGGNINIQSAGNNFHNIIRLCSTDNTNGVAMDNQVIMIAADGKLLKEGDFYGLISDSGHGIGHTIIDPVKVEVTGADGYYSKIDAGSVYTKGTISCVGLKHRIVETQNYNDRLQCCYETPVPMFGDVGEGQIDATGKCMVYLDDVFAETIDTDVQYQVFLQAYGDGNVYVNERAPAYFMVCGTPGMEFGWEIKAVQRGYDTIRLEAFEPIECVVENTTDILYRMLDEIEDEKTDDAEEAYEYLESILNTSGTEPESED